MPDDRATMWDQVEILLSECGCEVSVAPFQEYLSLVLHTRSPMRLTGFTSLDEAITLHLLDALELLRLERLRGGVRGIDVGSGAGFPGLPLAIAERTCSMVLLDSRKKKAGFLSWVCGRLRLANASVCTGRAEVLGRDPSWRDRFDFSVARALAPPPVALEYCLPLVRPGGKVFLWVGPSFESAELSVVLAELGGSLVRIHHYQLRPNRKRAIVEVKKTQATPQRFPRKPGAARKRPLK